MQKGKEDAHRLTLTNHKNHRAQRTKTPHLALYMQTAQRGGHSISHSTRDCGPVNTCITLGSLLPGPTLHRLTLYNKQKQ